MHAKVFELYDKLRLDFQDRKTIAVARSTRRGKVAKAIASQPLINGIGNPQKGLQLANGNFLINGQVIHEPDLSIWDVEDENWAFQKKAHGFFWLDHLSSSDLFQSKRVAKAWFAEWLQRFGDGDNLAWTPEIAGVRVISMINHAILLLNNASREDQKQYFSSISHHTRFLKKRWQYAPNGLPRFQALSGLVYCALALEDLAKDLQPAMRMLTKECEIYISKYGSIPSRNPEELLDIFTLLVWVEQGITHASVEPDRLLLKTIENIAPALRSLRMGDGALAEFHGGAYVPKLRIDTILSDSGARAAYTSDEVMGYSRVKVENSVVLMDTSLPPKVDKHAAKFDCALAIEFSSGKVPIFKSIGMNEDARLSSCKEFQAASAFTVASLQSINLAEENISSKCSFALADQFTVSHLRSETPNRSVETLSGKHTGYHDAFGLMYDRKIELMSKGYVLSGVDHMYCDQASDRDRFDREVKRQMANCMSVVSVFHLSPEVDAVLDLGGKAVSLQLPNGEMWIFKAIGSSLQLVESEYLSPQRLRPRATKQIVVTSEIVNYEGTVTWMLTRL